MQCERSSPDQGLLTLSYKGRVRPAVNTYRINQFAVMRPNAWR